MSARILLIIMLGNAPVICGVLFVMQFASRFMAMVLAVPLATFTLFAVVLLAIASIVSSSSVRLHRLLLTIAGRECCISSCANGLMLSRRQQVSNHLTTVQRMRLLHMMEHIGSSCQPLALHTIHGEVFTIKSLANHAMELSSHYLLLVTLSNYLVNK